MKIHSLKTDITDIQSDGAIIVVGDKYHILNESAAAIYQIIVDEHPEMEHLIQIIKELYIEIWDEKYAQIITDLFEILEIR